MTDKKTIDLIQSLAGKMTDLQIKTHENSLKISFVIWIMGAILLAILPAFGFLIAFWVQHNG